MAVRKISRSEAEALLYGSAILGGGGGGAIESGRALFEEAFRIGHPVIADITDWKAGDDGIVITTSAVGAPAAADQFVKTEDYNRILELITKKLPREPAALITNEVGAGSSYNAFIQSAKTGIPILDAACNGRAHPLGTMGAMGLSETKEYVSVQTAAGGDPGSGKYLELTVEGSVQATSALVRNAAVQAGGLVVVGRNPVSMEYVSTHAALGALSYAVRLGEAYLAAAGATEKISGSAAFLGGSVACRGRITQFELETKAGLDVGKFEIDQGGDHFEMFIWNEYMALNKNGKRLNTFPDLLMTFDAETGLPVTSAEIAADQDVTVIRVPHSQLILGAGMFEKTGYQAIEQVLGIAVLSYNQDLIR